jgi:CO/xanthine dehydrogenase Mo-binding subunit
MQVRDISSRIKNVDLSQAKQAPGVIDVFDGSDLASEFAAPLPMAWPVTEDIKIPEHWPVMSFGSSFRATPRPM